MKPNLTRYITDIYKSKNEEKAKQKRERDNDRACARATSVKGDWHLVCRGGGWGREKTRRRKDPLRCPSSFPASVGRISPPGVCDDDGVAAAAAAADECWLR